MFFNLLKLRLERELTLDFSTLDRPIGVACLIETLSESGSKDGKRGVPGGVRSLKTDQPLVNLTGSSIRTK